MITSMEDSMNGFSDIIKNIPWDTLPPWAVIGVVIVLVIGICIWKWIGRGKDTVPIVNIGDENKRLDADVSDNSKVKVGDKNEDIKLKIGGKR